MLNIEEFKQVALMPADNKKDWLQGSTGGVEYVVANSKTQDIILYAMAGRAYMHAVLASQENLACPDMEDLLREDFGSDRVCAIECDFNAEKGQKLYLAEHFDNAYSALVDGEQLVINRRFYGVEKKTVTEISQRLVHALNLYWLDTQNAFCRLNGDGDIEPIIRFFDFSKITGQPDDLVVTIDSHQLQRYMTVTKTVLVTKFDFMRFQSGDSFPGWYRVDVAHPSKDLYYHHAEQANASFALGVHIVHSLLNEEDVVKEYCSEWSDKDKEYATFTAYDWKNDRVSEISCEPDALASYFDKESHLPFEVTPAFFKPEVLQKYKSDSEKYTLDHRSIRSRAGWYLKTYDVNEAGQVHTYLVYLGQLPYSEQLYWKSFNEPPKSINGAKDLKSLISKRAHQTDIEGIFDTIYDPLIDLKADIAKLDAKPPSWWLPRGDELAASVHYPLTSSPDEWANAILTLDQFLVEGIKEKVLRERLVAAGKTPDEKWRSLKLLQEYASVKGLSESESSSLVEPIRDLHDHRSKVKGHATGQKQRLIDAARKEHISLAAHFRSLAENCQKTFVRVVELLGA